MWLSNILVIDFYLKSPWFSVGRSGLDWSEVCDVSGVKSGAINLRGDSAGEQDEGLDAAVAGPAYKCQVREGVPPYTQLLQDTSL